MIRNLLTLVACGGLVALVACSGSDEDEAFSTSSAFCTAKAEAECKNLAGTCGATEELCKPKRTDACNTAATAATGTGRAYRANAAQGCIDKVNAAFSPKVIDPAKETEANEACERVFGGTKAKNAACASTFECDGALVCDRGVCADKSATALGEACNNPGQVCAAGSYCQQQGQNKFCVEKKKVGEICTAEAPCKEDLRCVNSCVARVASGGACDKDEECAAEAPYCDPAAKKCRPKYQAGTQACRDYGGTL